MESTHDIDRARSPDAVSRLSNERLEGAQNRGPRQLPWASSTRGERPDMLAVDQFDTDRAEPIEVVIPGGLPSMGGVDAREDGYPSTEVLFKATVAASEAYNTATSGPSANHNRTHS